MEYLEFIGTILAMVSYSMLNIMVKKPPMIMILITFLISDLLIGIVAYDKGALWITSLMVFYTVMSIYGIYKRLTIG
jgi:hypothetical protein